MSDELARGEDEEVVIVAVAVVDVVDGTSRIALTLQFDMASSIDLEKMLMYWPHAKNSTLVWTVRPESN